MAGRQPRPHLSRAVAGLGQRAHAPWITSCPWSTGRRRFQFPGLTFYNGDALPKWKGDLFVGGVRYGEIPGTGRVDRVVLNEKFEEMRRESLLTDLHQRIRDVKQGPDGLLYVATDEEQGAILRIEPAQSPANLSFSNARAACTWRRICRACRCRS